MRRGKGCAAVILFYGLLALVLVSQAVLSPPPTEESGSDGTPPRDAPVPSVTLRAVSGATILFKTQNGETMDGVAPQTLELPHLVLYRNGALTGPSERALIVEVTGIDVPPPGVTVVLQVETEHGDPNLGGGSEDRIAVWRESQWIANTSSATQAGAIASFRHEFGATVASGGGTIATPTDYFRYDVAVVDASHPGGDPWHAFGADHAFLMENQWAVPLPEVQETSEGAAPDELIVYACDMFPYQKDDKDVTTWLPREDVSRYVQTELVPHMIEVFRAQTDDWGFPWHDAWTSLRSWEDAERLSIALAEGQTWFHGPASSGGNNAISIRVEGGETAHYDTLTDGLMSNFHHELFHNLQRNINQRHGGSGDIDGEQNAYQFFSEGTAVLASSVGHPLVQFAQTMRPRAYVFNANGFVGGRGLIGDLNKSYEEIKPYHAAIYWRFLYERCGGMANGVENPAAGMRVIKHVLTVLYSGEVVNIASSADLVGAVPEVMDRALAGSTCPFQTYAESLVAFARAIYALRLEGGRCAAPGIPLGCGFYDPVNLYPDPRCSTITYAGTAVSYATADQPHPAGIKSSFGVDFVDVVLDPAADGRSLTLEFYGTPGADAEFRVQLWKLMDAMGGAKPQPVPSQTTVPEVLTGADADGRLVTVISAIDTTAYNRLGLIITRIDARESLDPIGAYTILLHTGTDSD